VAEQVSVDIRSPLAGVLAEVCAKVGDSVQVGATLFKVDSSDGGKASVAASAPAPAAPAPAAATSAPAKPTPTPAAAPASSASSAHSSSSHHGHRVPSIKFKYGKRCTLFTLFPLPESAGLLKFATDFFSTADSPVSHHKPASSSSSASTSSSSSAAPSAASVKLGAVASGVSASKSIEFFFFSK
jgi:hypothetical protein